MTKTEGCEQGLIGSMIDGRGGSPSERGRRGRLDLSGRVDWMGIGGWRELGDGSHIGWSRRGRTEGRFGGERRWSFAGKHSRNGCTIRRRANFFGSSQTFTRGWGWKKSLKGEMTMGELTTGVTGRKLKRLCRLSKGWD